MPEHINASVMYPPTFSPNLKRDIMKFKPLPTLTSLTRSLYPWQGSSHGWHLFIMINNVAMKLFFFFWAKAFVVQHQMLIKSVCNGCNTSILIPWWWKSVRLKMSSSYFYPQQIVFCEFFCHASGNKSILTVAHRKYQTHQWKSVNTFNALNCEKFIIRRCHTVHLLQLDVSLWLQISY